MVREDIGPLGVLEASRRSGVDGKVLVCPKEEAILCRDVSMDGSGPAGSEKRDSCPGMVVSTVVDAESE